MGCRKNDAKPNAARSSSAQSGACVYGTVETKHKGARNKSFACRVDSRQSPEKRVLISSAVVQIIALAVAKTHLLTLAIRAFAD